ncbi:MAG: YlmC/YmxH family sporulation protein [Candidatus Gallimonas sp.]
METSFGDLKRKEVVNLGDGKQLGRVCDVVFTFPEGKVQGIVVPGGRGFRFGKADLFIDLRNVTKIGVDVVLVDVKSAHQSDKKKERGRCEPDCPPPCDPHGRDRPDRRDYGEYE